MSNDILAELNSSAQKINQVEITGATARGTRGKYLPGSEDRIQKPSPQPAGWIPFLFSSPGSESLLSREVFEHLP